MGSGDETSRGLGIFYHVNDVEGREDLIECRRIVDVPTPIVTQLTVPVHEAVLQWTMGTPFWQFIRTRRLEQSLEKGLLGVL